MQSTFRRVANNLWVSDVESAVKHANEVAIIVDCLGDTTYGGTKAKILHLKPSGRGSHSWTVADLDRLTSVVGKYWPAYRVMIHCRRGVSRSPVAAAALLLATGAAVTPQQALRLTASSLGAPSTQSVSGLLAWDEQRRQRQLAL